MNTYVIVTHDREEQHTMVALWGDSVRLWHEVFPMLLTTPTVALVLEHSGWQVIGDPTFTIQGWYQEVHPIIKEEA